MTTPPQLLTSKNEEWNTPIEIFRWLDSHFHFTVDAAADFHNALCDSYFDAAMNGLAQDWDTHTVFCNPPYGRKQIDWVRKAAASKGTSVLLIPARVDSKVWQEVIFAHASAVIFLKGRLTFTLGAKTRDPATFPSAVVVFGVVPEGFLESLSTRGFGIRPRELLRAS